MAFSLYKTFRREHKRISQIWKHSRAKHSYRSQPWVNIHSYHMCRNDQKPTLVTLSSGLRISLFYSQQTSKTASQTHSHLMFKLVEEENEYFHKYLEENEKFREYLVNNSTNLEQSVNMQSCTELLDSVQEDSFDFSVENVHFVLKQLSILPLSFKTNLLRNESFQLLSRRLIENLPKMTDKLFFDSMTILAKFNLRRAVTGEERMFRLQIVQAFDKESAKRSPFWDVKSHFLAADLLYHFRSTGMIWCQFMPKFTDFFSNILQELTDTEVILLMFHVNLYRHMPSSHLLKLTKIIHSRIQDIADIDLGIVCLGFFKSKAVIRNNALLDAMIPRLKGMVTLMDDVCLSAVMKYLQRLTHKRMVKAAPHTMELITDLQPELLARLKQANISTALHVISMYENIHDITEDMIHEMYRKVFSDDIGQWRLKDIAILSKFIGNLSSPVPESQCCQVFEILSDELQREERRNERRLFLDKLSFSLLGMSFVGFYPIKLIEQVFNKEGHEFFERCKMDLRRDLFQLSESVRIEVPDYPGPFFEKKFLPQSQMKVGRQLKMHERAKPTSVRDVMLQEIIHSCAKILGGLHFVKIEFLLSHYQTQDVELQVDPSGLPLPVTQWNNKENGPNRRIALLLHGLNAYYIVRRRNGSKEMTLGGQHATKGRQLRKLGYEVIDISCHEFEQETNKQDHLREKLRGCSVHV